jgi:hypothetical protein
MAEADNRSHRIELDLGADDERPSRFWIVITTLTATGLLMAACVCGFALYLFRPSFSHDPSQVRQLTEDLLSIELSEEWQAGGTIEWNILWIMMFRGAYYEWPDAHGQLAIVAVDGQLLDQEDVRSHVVRQLQEAGGSAAIVVEHEETRDIVLDGRPTSFVFQKGKETTSQVPIRLVEGVVEGPRGPVLIALRIDQSSYDEQQILHMLTSIKPL